MSTALSPIKVDKKSDELISHAAHFMNRSKKDIVDAAVREYVESHKAEIQQGVLEALKLLDGSTESSVKLLTGMSSEELSQLGGFEK